MFYGIFRFGYNRMQNTLTVGFLCLLVAACSRPERIAPIPTQIIDLTPTITADQPVQMWGRRMLSDFGFREKNKFEFVINQEPVYGSNSYWTLFNHTGAHLDSPSHMIKGGQTVDLIPLASTIGIGRLLDFRHKHPDEEISLNEIIDAAIKPGEIGLLVVKFDIPVKEGELPAYAALSPAAAQYLAELPVRAIGTNGFSVESVARMYESMNRSETGNEAITPNHLAFLQRRIPVFEGLANLENLSEVDQFVFVGFPLKVRDGDGSPVRAAALIYE